MANQLKMADVQAIVTLWSQGWSQREIARKLQVNRETVSRHLRLAAAGGGPQGDNSKPAKAPPGSEVAGEVPNPAKAPSGSTALEPAEETGGSDARGRSRSNCQVLREVILEKMRKGLSAQRIYQDLLSERGFTGSYYSVRRFVRQLGQDRTYPFRRMECQPGAEAQVDFGTGAMILRPDGKRRRPYVLRVVLSHSRKGYSEAVYRQTSDEFIRCLENAFAHFAGVPRVLVIDNLRAAVKRADWFDPELCPKMRSFCQHYGTVVLPTKPYTPRHKGKVENGVKYVQDNALKGRQFASLEQENRHLLDWELSVADTRIHGTTRQQVSKVFQEVERGVLLPLPLERFPCFREGRRSVHRDGHVEVDKAYYSVPPEYMGREVWVRWDERVVRVFNDRMEQITLHAKREPGRFSTQGEHIAPQKISGVEQGATRLLEKASWIGPQTGRWAELMLSNRGIEGIRVLVGLISLSKQHPPASIERACEVAASHGAYHLRIIRKLIQRRGCRQEQFEFMDQHPIIRGLGDYGELVRSAFRAERAANQQVAGAGPSAKEYRDA